jgi:hypothetical protein
MILHPLTQSGHAETSRAITAKMNWQKFREAPLSERAEMILAHAIEKPTQDRLANLTMFAFWSEDNWTEIRTAVRARPQLPAEVSLVLSDCVLFGWEL